MNLTVYLPRGAPSHCSHATAEIHLTGTKLGCAEGGCGACTVMVSHQAGIKLVHRSVNACLCPLYAVEGMHIVTVEGVKPCGVVSLVILNDASCSPCKLLQVCQAKLKHLQTDMM